MWRVIPEQALTSRCWGDETVLYNDLSGATHLLGAAAMCLLDTLREGPAGEAALCRALLAEFDIDPDDLPQQLDSLLADLARLDLIELHPC